MSASTVPVNTPKPYLSSEELPPTLGNFPTTTFGLELSIAFLQAYVFTVLSAIYIKDTLYLH